MNEQPRLDVGDQVWFLNGTLLYEATIAEVRVSLVGEPGEFAMYRVTSRSYCKYFEDRSQHRSDLFRQPSERDALIREVESRIESLESMLKDLESEGEETLYVAADEHAPAPEPVNLMDALRKSLERVHP